MNIHSKLLVHWPGRDIVEKIKNNNLSPDEENKLYFDRLKDDLTNGVFATFAREPAIRKIIVKDLVRFCFTEIKLSQAQNHAQQYGKLGIGFSQDFILARGGRPVIYIPYKEENGLLEESLRQIYHFREEFPQLEKSIRNVLSYIKRMSESQHETSRSRNSIYYDEMEWRVVYNPDLEGKYFSMKNGNCRLTFSEDDLKIIIFPNNDVRAMAYDDAELMGYIKRSKPTIVTLEDCDNF